MLLNPFRFSAEGAPATDPHWASVFSLVHFNNADGSTTLTCQKGLAYNRVGDPVVKSASALYGTSGGKFFGTNGYNYWRSSGVGGNFSAVFTIEAMVRFTDATQDWIPFSLGLNSYTLIPYLSGGVIKLQTFSGVLSGVTPVSAGQWVHIAVVKSAGTAYLYVNGILQGSKSNDGTNGRNTITLGGAPNYFGQIRNFKGDMDEFRMTDGVARYTANFTPPSAPFPDS